MGNGEQAQGTQTVNRNFAGIPLWMWGLGGAALIGALAFMRKHQAAGSPAKTPTPTGTTAFSSQQQLQDFGIFQSLSQAQQGADLQYLSEVLSLFGGSSMASSGSPGGTSGGGTSTLPAPPNPAGNPGGTATPVPANGSQAPPGTVFAMEGPNFVGRGPQGAFVGISNPATAGAYTAQGTTLYTYAPTQGFEPLSANEQGTIPGEFLELSSTPYGGVPPS